MGKGYKKNENKPYCMVQTKLTAEDKEKVRSIAEGFNLTIYGLLQGLLLSILKYFDKYTAISYEHSQMANAFTNILSTLQSSFNPLTTRNNERETISKAILFAEIPNKAPQLISVAKDGKGAIEKTYNLDTMLEDFLRAFDEETLQVLKQIQKHLGIFSLAHTLRTIIMLNKPSIEGIIEKEIREEFSDIRIPTGETTNEDIYYKRIKNSKESCVISTHKKHERLSTM
jgi:hypothetical protein